MRVLWKLLILPVKLLALLVSLVLLLVLWAGIFLTSFSAVFFYLLSGLFFLIAIVGYLMGLAAGAEAFQMMACGFVLFIIPHMAGWLLAGVDAARCGLHGFIRP